MKQFILFFAVLFAVIFIPGFSGAKDKIDMKNAMILIKVEKKNFISEVIKLTPKENEAFWPVYNRFQEALQKILSRTSKLIDDYAKEHEELSEEKARDMLERFLAIQADRIELKKLFAKKFYDILPPTKVLKYFQLENKIEAGVNYTFAVNIPVVK